MPEDTAADGRGPEPADGEDGGADETNDVNPPGAGGDPEGTGADDTESPGSQSGSERPGTATSPTEEDDTEAASGAVQDLTPEEKEGSDSETAGPPEESTTGPEHDDEDSPEAPEESEGQEPTAAGSAAEESEAEESTAEEPPRKEPEAEESELPPDVRQYARFKKVDGSRYERVNDFLRDRTYITAREWAIARLCADFRTETGVEMTKIGENLPELVPFMTDTYSPQAVNQARAAFEEKVRMAGATFLYGAMCDFFTAEELDDLIYEVTEVAKFLLEVEGVDLAVEDELETEDRISEVMREVRTASEALRNGPLECPECGHDVSVEHLEADE